MTLPVVPSYLAITGRVKSWLESPSKRLPVSCTVFVVEDSMEGKDGIEDSWTFASKALRNAAGVAIHLSNLRPKGTANPEGLVASGPVSFAKIYSMINEILRRGGHFKNGAITVHLDYDHPDALNFITTPRHELPWVKRCLNVDNDFINWDGLEQALEACRSGDLWLVKKITDSEGNRIYHNVCLEINLRSRGTCLLSHVNLGKCPATDLPEAFEDGMHFLCQLHAQTGTDDSGIYLSSAEDKQVGLGVLGLANRLAIDGITYLDFVSTLERYLHNYTNKDYLQVDYESPAYILVHNLFLGFQRAATVAKSYGMVRAFTVAPTATCSYRYTDSEGYTTTPEIAPPIDRQIDRDSDTFGVMSYDYNPKVEIASEVGWDVFFRLNCAWQKLMNVTGLAHSMSTNWWSDMTVMDKDFVNKWLESPLLSLYYSLQVMPSTQDKSTVWIDNDFSILGLDEKNTACGISEDEKSFCSACAE
jgi:hypothetical protein